MQTRSPKLCHVTATRTTIRPFDRSVRTIRNPSANATASRHRAKTVSGSAARRTEETGRTPVAAWAGPTSETRRSVTRGTTIAAMRVAARNELPSLYPKITKTTARAINSAAAAIQPVSRALRYSGTGGRVPSRRSSLVIASTLTPGPSCYCTSPFEHCWREAHAPGGPVVDRYRHRRSPRGRRGRRADRCRIRAPPDKTMRPARRLERWACTTIRVRVRSLDRVSRCLSPVVG